jgi:hypothetical protein
MGLMADLLLCKQIWAEPDCTQHLDDVLHGTDLISAANTLPLYRHCTDHIENTFTIFLCGVDHMENTCHVIAPVLLAACVA